MEARGRSEACRIRLGQATAWVPKAIPPPSALVLLLSCYILRMVAGSTFKVEEGSPTDRNEWNLSIHTDCMARPERNLVLSDSDLYDWQALRATPQS